MKTNEVKNSIEIVDRTTILGGSDANRIMRGITYFGLKRPSEKNLRTYLGTTVQIGLHTEKVNQMFFEKK